MRGMIPRSLVLLLALTAPALAQSQPDQARASAQSRSDQARASAQAAREQARPEAFVSPEVGFGVLAAAARLHEEQLLLRILGQAAAPLIRSGEPEADRAAQTRLAEAYAARAEILRPAPDRAELVVGADGFPFPIPMRREGEAWRFDTAAGLQALVDRRIGRNELDTIAVLQAIVAAQQEYASGPGRQGGFRTYARRLFSTPGQRDGLWWPTTEGEPPSPLGPLVAAASTGGYGRRAPDEAPRPFHGYLFRLLEAQGPNAPGGAMDYAVRGKLIGGFGVIAVPARWGETGIQTFIVSHAGQVFQRNLGRDTAKIAAGITTFDPGPGWQPVGEVSPR